MEAGELNQGPEKVFHCVNEIAFDRPLEFLYTLLFVRDATILSGAVPENREPLVGRVSSSVPEQCKTEWDRRAAGMGRQPRKAE